MSRTPTDAPGRRIRAVEISFGIIGLLQRDNGLGVTAIAEELGHSKSTVYSHLKTLEDQRIVIREADGYRLSLRVLDVAEDVREQIGNYSVIEEEVESLAAETDEIAQFGIEEYGRVAYLCKTMGDQAVVTASAVGTQQPIHSTSLGKAILAFLPPEEREAIVDATALEPKTEATITDLGAFREELERTRERGYSVDDEENIEGLRCVAAPVKDGENVLGAVSLSGPSSRFTDERLGDLAGYVQRAANVIELNTKFS